MVFYGNFCAKLKYEISFEDSLLRRMFFRRLLYMCGFPAILFLVFSTYLKFNPRGFFLEILSACQRICFVSVTLAPKWHLKSYLPRAHQDLVSTIV